MANFDPSLPGNPYIRASNISIDFPPPGMGNPTVTISQKRAVTLIDGTSVEFQDVGTFTSTIDLANCANIEYPLVDINNDKELGSNVTLQDLVLYLASYVRLLQKQNTQD